MRRTTITALLAGLFSMFGVVALVGLTASTSAATPRTDFCEWKPNHPKCTTPSPEPTPTPTPTPDPTPTPAPEPTPTPDPGGSVCTDPEWTSSQDGATHGWQVTPYDPPNGVGFYGQIMVDNNMWNAGGYNVSQTVGACSYDSWYAVTTADNSRGDGAVKTYPNVHIDYVDWGTGWMQPLSEFSSLKMRFAHDAPSTEGIWNVAFDVWLNGIGNGEANELMIWTENHNQRPAGTKIDTVTLDGVQWDFWAGYDNHYLAFVPTTGAAIPAGELELLAFTDYLAANGHIPASSTIGQLDYGVEVVSTNGVPARFDFTDFAVTEVLR